MSEVKVIDVKLKIIRGRAHPTERRLDYSTVVDYIITEGETGEKLSMSVVPPVYFYLKRVLNEEFDDLERVIFHTIQEDDRTYLEEFILTNNLLKINLKKILTAAIERIVIDRVREVGRTGYIFSASIYLNNGQRIPNVIPSDAVAIAILGGKDIFVKTKVLEEKKELDKLIDDRMTQKKEEKPEPDEKKPDIPKNIYT